MAKTVCIATGARSDWGILSPLAVALRDSGLIDVRILATNMHLMDAFGHTASEIEKDGFAIDAAVDMAGYGDTPAGRARAMGRCTAGTADALAAMRPDAVMLLGDRYEMLAVASAAAVMGIPIIHLHGGEITEGAVDDSLRHAITKLSSLHLVAAEEYRRRVVSLGENPRFVVNAGSLGVWNMCHTPRIPRRELLESLGLPSDSPFAVATFHPATLDPADPAGRCKAMTDALDRFPGLNVVATYPNNDAGSEAIIAVLKEWATANPGRVALVPNLGLRRFVSAAAEAAVVVGNSSGALIEVPALRTPAVNIGIRQKGRLHSDAVIDCGDSADEIARAISLALSPEMGPRLDSPNPYYRDDTLRTAVDAVESFMESLPLPPKKFYDRPS